MSEAWPIASLDPVQQLRALAAGVRGAAVTERVYRAPVETVWQILGDLEDGFGRVQPDLSSVRVIAADGDRVEAIAVSRYGMRAHLSGVLRPGWCWLQSRFLVIGMAAADAGDGTRVALTGGCACPADPRSCPWECVARPPNHWIASVSFSRTRGHKPVACFAIRLGCPRGDCQSEPERLNPRGWRARAVRIRTAAPMVCLCALHMPLRS